MAAAPDQLEVGRDRDLTGRGYHPWVRRGLLTLLGIVPILALLNVFGQRPATSKAATPEATLKVYSPTHLRGGLLYTSRFTITAHQQVNQATLVLSGGWMEQLTFNAVVPQPTQQASKNGKLYLQLGQINAGRSFILYISYQVNPTNVGRRSQDVELLDGTTRLALIHRTVTIWP